MGGRGGSSGSKGGGAKQEFKGVAEVDGYEFRSWSKGDMDRIYYGEIAKRRRNGQIPSEGYIDAQTGEIVRQGNNAGVEAAGKFKRDYEYQTKRVKERAAAKESVRKKMANKSTSFTDTELSMMSRQQIETVARRVVEKRGLAKGRTLDAVKKSKNYKAIEYAPDSGLIDYIKKYG